MYLHFDSSIFLATFVMLMLTTMNNRLQQFLAAENISQAQLADSLNVARAGVSHILAGRNKPSYDFLSALMMHYPRLNVEWLMFGKGKMYKDRTAEPKPEPESEELLFSDHDLMSTEISDRQPDMHANIQASTEMNKSDNIVQNIVKQRNVKKVIIMFDDGTFQEM